MLKKHEVKVWALLDQELPNYSDQIEKLKFLLSSQESSYLAGCVNPLKRKRYLSARYMIWRTVATHLEKDWETLNGLNPRDLVYQNIYWSVTYTEGLTMTAFCLGQKVGIDVESLKSRRDVLKIAERYFDEEERALLFSSSPYMVEENFLKLWTTKEAHYKWKSFGNFYKFLGESCLQLQTKKDVWGLKWERDFFFTVVTNKHPESNLEVKPFSKNLFKTDIVTK